MVNAERGSNFEARTIVFNGKRRAGIKLWGKDYSFNSKRGAMIKLWGIDRLWARKAYVQAFQIISGQTLVADVTVEQRRSKL